MAESLTLPPAIAGLGLGLALASTPGPVQAVLLAETIRGGFARGMRALAGANLTFGTLLVGAALGFSAAAPAAVVIRLLEVAGGLLLLWLGADALRSEYRLEPQSARRNGLPPAARGALAVLLNPGAWLFLPMVAAPLFVSATRSGSSAVWSALALIGGIAIGDASVVLLGSIGVRRAGKRTGQSIRIALALVLLAFAVWLLAHAFLD